MTTPAPDPAPDPAPRGTRGGARRDRLVAAVGALAGAGLVVLASGRTWVTAHPVEVPGVTVVAATGSQTAPVASALALVAAAGAVALLVTGRAGRRLAAGVLALAGVGVVAAAAGVLADPAGAAAGAVTSATGRTGGALPPAAAGPWVWLASAAGAAVAACGSYALLRAGSWPAPGRRFETATAVAATGEGEPPGRVAPREGGNQRPTGPDAVGAWDALSRGEDPTG